MTRNILNQSVVVVLRSAKERTTSLCRQLILEQGIDLENITTLEITPFSKALRVSYNFGIERGKKWLLCVDADVLLRSKSIATLIDFADRQAPNTFEVQGAILDKFFGGARSGGIHLYRAEFLTKAIQFIPDATNVRPERTTLSRMSAQGYPWVEIPYVVGLHDFEQFYADIYRKCFVHGHKHLKFTELLVDVWKSAIQSEPDYRVALKGMCDGILYQNAVAIDKNASYFDFDLKVMNLVEKESITSADWSVDKVDRIMENWQEPEKYAQYFPEWSAMYRHSVPSSTYNPRTYRDYRSKLGFIRGTGFIAGRFLEKMGRIIQRVFNDNKSN